MAEIILTPKVQPQVPIEADSVTPDAFAGKSIDEIKNIELWFGNEKAPLSDFFDVEGESSENASEIKIIIDGDVGNTKRIGQGMTTGEIVVKGNVSMYVGAEMKGGKITVEGNCRSMGWKRNGWWRTHHNGQCRRLRRFSLPW